jgi:hypothetical protein
VGLVGNYQVRLRKAIAIILPMIDNDRQPMTAIAEAVKLIENNSRFTRIDQEPGLTAFFWTTIIAIGSPLTDEDRRVGIQQSTQ